MANKKEMRFECSCGIRVSAWQKPYQFRHIDCPKCGEVMTYIRQPTAEQRRITGHYLEPIEMYSVALERGELAGFKAALPDTDLTEMGVPIARTRQEKLKILDFFGYEERN